MSRQHKALAGTGLIFATILFVGLLIYHFGTYCPLYKGFNLYAAPCPAHEEGGMLVAYTIISVIFILISFVAGLVVGSEVIGE